MALLEDLAARRSHGHPDHPRRQRRGARPSRHRAQGRRGRQGQRTRSQRRSRPTRSSRSDAGRRRRAARMLSGLNESLRMAMRALRANIFRTVLTLLGIVIGVGSVVAMLAIGEGAKQRVVAADRLDGHESCWSSAAIHTMRAAAGRSRTLTAKTPTPSPDCRTSWPRCPTCRATRSCASAISTISRTR